MLFDRMPSRSFLYLLYNDDWKTRVLFGTKGAFYEHKQIQKCEMKKNGTRIKFGWDGVLASECHFRTAPTSAWPSRATRSLYGRAFLECSASLSDAESELKWIARCPHIPAISPLTDLRMGKTRPVSIFGLEKYTSRAAGNVPTNSPTITYGGRGARGKPTYLLCIACLEEGTVPSFAHAYLHLPTLSSSDKHAYTFINIQTFRERSKSNRCACGRVLHFIIFSPHSSTN